MSTPGGTGTGGDTSGGAAAADAKKDAAPPTVGAKRELDIPRNRYGLAPAPSPAGARVPWAEGRASAATAKRRGASRATCGPLGTVRTRRPVAGAPPPAHTLMALSLPATRRAVHRAAAALHTEEEVEEEGAAGPSRQALVVQGRHSSPEGAEGAAGTPRSGARGMGPPRWRAGEAKA